MKNKDIIDKITARVNSDFLGTQLYPEEAIKPYAPTTRRRKKRAYHVRNPEKMAEKRKSLKDYQWKPGQSGNPKGRPVNPLSLSALLNKKLATHPELADAIVNALISLGLGKDIRAIEMAFERVDGKVVERHQIEGEFPVRIQFVPAEMLIGEERQKQIARESHLELPEGTETNAPA